MIKKNTLFFRLSLVLLVLSITFGCKSTKSITSTGALNKELSAKQIIKENTKQAANFKTLQAKIKIEYKEGEKSKSVGVNLRLEKDKTIWMSAFYGVAKALITPNRVAFYDKWNNQYFDGDYTILSNLLGIELDFDKVQNLMLGESLFNLKKNNYKASTNEASYVLEPKRQNTLLELFLLLNPAHFKIDSQQLYQPLKKRFLQIDYKTYQDVDNQILPQNIEIVAVEDDEQVLIEMEYKSVSLNENMRFPFKIPSGFKEIVIKDAE